MARWSSLHIIMTRHHKKIIDVTSAIILLTLAVLDAMIWSTVSDGGTSGKTQIYFLPVTQGESALLSLANNVSILTDAGGDGGIVEDLQKAVPHGDGSYIDLAIISYPQSADYEGYEYLLEHFQIGAFLYNGRDDAVHRTDWQKLTDAIAARHIPFITVKAGDRIRCGTLAEIDILSPDGTFVDSPEPDDTGIVQRVITPRFTALLTADIGANVENALLARGEVLAADILKAPFPGLGTAAGDAFLRAVAPKTIVIDPGIKNTASAPTKALLAYLASSTSATIATAGHGSFLLYNK